VKTRVKFTSIIMASFQMDPDESVQFICSVAKLIPPVLIDLVSSDDEETMENVSERFYRSIRA